MRSGLVAANWKMNGLRVEIDTQVDQILASIGELEFCEVVICPPSLYMGQLQKKLSGTTICLGAQNIYFEDKGAFTGEISAEMLTEFNCSYVIVGHSERRELFFESDAQVAAKYAAAQQQGLIPILCVGESLEQRESGETDSTILRQLDAVLERNGVESFEQAVIAYEPIWAIGTGLTASPDQAQEVHKLIRDKLGSLNRYIAENLKILYGGSVKASNAAELFAMDDIDGALVGGASLIAEEFTSICASIG